MGTLAEVIFLPGWIPKKRATWPAFLIGKAEVYRVPLGVASPPACRVGAHRFNSDRDRSKDSLSILNQTWFMLLYIQMGGARFCDAIKYGNICCLFAVAGAR